MAWREIARLADQAGKAMQLCPGEVLREASAHFPLVDAKHTNAKRAFCLFSIVAEGETFRRTSSLVAPDALHPVIRLPDVQDPMSKPVFSLVKHSDIDEYCALPRTASRSQSHTGLALTGDTNIIPAVEAICAVIDGCEKKEDHDLAATFRKRFEMEPELGWSLLQEVFNFLFRPANAVEPFGPMSVFGDKRSMIPNDLTMVNSTLSTRLWCKPE
jgi:hypothetical protein